MLAHRNAVSNFLYLIFFIDIKFQKIQFTPHFVQVFPEKNEKIV